jgi:lipoprotein-anchoring transpeptidase ErfK/SrfK
MISSTHNTIRRSVKVRRLIKILSGAAIIILCSSCEETPPYAQQLFAPGYPPGAPPGYWNDEGASGPPKIVVHIGEQKAYFYKGKHVVGESTVSSGKPGFSTPPGHYRIVSKDRDHVSTEFGDYVDDYGNVVRSNIDARKDRRPPGTHFDGARMPYAMFFNGGYAMHQGYVPPFAASHGCIRVPKGMAQPFFENAPEGTPVIVNE